MFDRLCDLTAPLALVRPPTRGLALLLHLFHGRVKLGGLRAGRSTVSALSGNCWI